MFEAWRARAQRFLRWAERYTKTDMVYLATGGFWLSVGQVAYIPLAFGLSVAFANLVPPEAYGTYRYILSAGTIISVFAFTGIDTAIPQAVARGYEGMLRKGFMMYLKWSWLMIAAGGVAATYYFFHGNATLGYGMLIAGATGPVFAGASLYGEYLAGKRAFRLGAVLSALQTAFLTFTMLVTMAVAPDPLTLVAAYFFANMVSALVLYIYVRRRFRPGDEVDPASVRFGYHLSLTNVISVVGDQLDKVLLFHLVGAAELAAYSFAIALPDYVRSLPKMFGTLAVPKFAIADQAALRHTLLRKTALLALALAAAAVCYALAAPLIFRIFYPRYLIAVPYSQVYALVIIAGAVVLPSAALTATRALRAQYTISLTDNSLKIALLIVLAWLYGVWGVVVARIIGRYVTLFLSLFSRGGLRDGLREIERG